MALPTKHIRSQGPVIKMLGATAAEVLRRKITGKVPSGTGPLPGPEISMTIPPRPRALIKDYVRFCGGDPNSYKHTLPAHLWPQWGFPLAARTLESVPYPLLAVLNGGCRVEVNGAIANDEPLEVRAQLVSIDETERRAVLEQRVTTGTAANPEAIIATLYAIVPLNRDKGGKNKGGPKRKNKQKERVPLDADELARWRIPQNAGLAFAMLTGDFNPVHWVVPYAKAFGFRSTILHGFASMAKAWEGLVRSRYGGASTAIRSFDIQFTKPLVLPAKVGLYARPLGPESPSQDRVWLAAAPGASPYLVGTVDGVRSN